MRKIPTVFQRDPDNMRYVTRNVHPDCQWVLDGEGTPTYKWDGTSVLIDDDGAMWKRRELKAGQTEPDGFRLEGHDETTGKTVGWMPCNRDNPDDRWHWEAYDPHPQFESITAPHKPGTYELLGPKVQGNPHKFDHHVLMPHGAMPFNAADGEFYAPPPLGYDGLAGWMTEFAKRDAKAALGFEGIVWHHPDGRMAKLKARDFPKVG